MDVQKLRRNFHILFTDEFLLITQPDYSAFECLLNYLFRSFVLACMQVKEFMRAKWTIAY